MTATRIHVFPTVDLTAEDARMRAARAALFGPGTRIFPGGWSFFDDAALRRHPLSPLRVVNQQEALEAGRTFMEEANQRWRDQEQDTDLLPVDQSLFRLVPAEIVYLKQGARPAGWRVTWLVLAKAARGAEADAQAFVHVENASISLSIGLTGTVVGGSAHWRPTQQPISAQQHVSKADVEAVLAGGGAGSAHAHGTDHADGEPHEQGVALTYSIGSRSEFRNYIDPRLRHFEGGHRHGPPLIVPVTEYGINAEIVSVARRLAGASASGEVELYAWITDCHGAVETSPLPDGYEARWVVQDITAPDAAPRVYEGAEPISLQGLYQVSFSVRNGRGCMAQTHLEVCSFVDQGRPAMPVA